MSKINEEFLIKLIEDSLLFDAEWYIETYGIELQDPMSPALHYLAYGWKMGYNPSEYFDIDEYLEDNPEVKDANLCPLVHWEIYGLTRRSKIRVHNITGLREKHPECLGGGNDLTLRLRITNRCNSKCRYCGQLMWSKEEQQMEMEPVWYYEYLEPLYKNIKQLLITGGDAYLAKESYNYMKFISEKYPQITIKTESNGLAFDQKFREMASDNLFKTHFSLNASKAEIFEKSCYAGEHAHVVYNKILDNVRNYILLLEEKNLLCFAPSFSMVINKDNYYDVYGFVKLCLSLRACNINFYFDYTESAMGGDYFGEPQTSRAALLTMLEIERVLAKKVYIQFRLWIPGKELEPLQKVVDAMEIEELRRKYSELLELAKDRDMKREFEERNHIRREHGKMELTFAEEWNAFLRTETINGKNVCASPWKVLDLYPNGRMDFCCWFVPILNIRDYICNGKLDIEEIVNSIEYMAYRNHFLHEIYWGCMPCCPCNDIMNPINSLHDKGYLRDEN